MKEIWQERLRHAVTQTPEGTTFAAFNLNVDVVARVTPDAIDRLIERSGDLNWQTIQSIDVEGLRSVKTREDFIAVLRHGFQTGKSALLVRDTEELVPWWREIFLDRTESMGGQAGIIANQMAALGARSVVYSPLLSPKQAELFLDGVAWPVDADPDLGFNEAKAAGRPDDVTREPWVFEYRKGEVFHFPDKSFTTPRANRAIITTGISGPERRFHGDLKSRLADLGRAVDVGFLAGYHQCGNSPDDPKAVRAYMETSCRDLRVLRRDNPRLKLHIEYVPAKVREVEREFYQLLGQEIHSFGINEVEIRALLRRFGRDELADELERNERAFLLYQGGLHLLRALGVERFHIHNLGYYVMVLKKPYGVSPEHVRAACLYASAVNARKAQDGGFVRRETLHRVAELAFADVGYQQLEAFADEARIHPPAGASREQIDRFAAEGILEADDHYVLVTPSHVVPNPVGTVGMGDTISSSAYFSEVSGGS